MNLKPNLQILLFATFVRNLSRKYIRVDKMMTTPEDVDRWNWCHKLDSELTVDTEDLKNIRYEEKYLAGYPSNASLYLIFLQKYKQA